MELERAIATTALAKAVPSKDEKAAAEVLADGCNHGFELLVKVVGRLTKGQPTSAKAKSPLLCWAVVAELLRRCGVTRASAERHLAEIAAQALATGGKVGEELVAANPEILVVMYTAEKSIVDKLKPTSKRGEIKVMSAIDWHTAKVNGDPVSMAA